MNVAIWDHQRRPDSNNNSITMYSSAEGTTAVRGCHSNIIYYQWLQFDYLGNFVKTWSHMTNLLNRHHSNSIPHLQYLSAKLKKRLYSFKCMQEFIEEYSLCMCLSRLHCTHCTVKWWQLATVQATGSPRPGELQVIEGSSTSYYSLGLLRL